MPHWVDRFVLASLKNCGTGSGGFEAGNTCAGGGGGALTETKDIGTRETTEAEAVGRGGAIAQHLGGLSGAEFTKETARILTASGMSKEEAKVFAKSLDRSMKHALKTIAPLAGWGQDPESAALEAVMGSACGFVAGIALYKEITGTGLEETNLSAGSSLPIELGFEAIKDITEERLAIYPESTKSAYGGYFGVVVKDGKTIDTRPRVVLNVMTTAEDQNKVIGQIARNSIALSNLARNGLGEGNFTIGSALVQMALSPNDDNIKGVSYSGDRESLRRMGKSAFGRTALKAMHAAIHELGHWQHYKAIEKTVRVARPTIAGRGLWAATRVAWQSAQSNNSGEWANAAKSISRYAKSSSVEFVAEVYSGLAMGFRFNDDVLREYAALGGPGLKRKKS